MFVSCKKFFEKINELLTKIQQVSDNQQHKLLNCEGQPLAALSKIPTCDVMNAAIDAKAETTLQESNQYTDNKMTELNQSFNNKIDLIENGMDGMSETAHDVFNEKVKILVSQTNWDLVTHDGNLRLSLPKCRAKVKSVRAPYTLAVDDEVVVVSNGGVVTVPNLDVGREVMIIQGAAAVVSLRGANGVNVITPVNGSLNLQGQNAAVSLLATDSNVVRVFGQTVGV